MKPIKKLHGSSASQLPGYYFLNNAISVTGLYNAKSDGTTIMNCTYIKVLEWCTYALPQTLLATTKTNFWKI